MQQITNMNDLITTLTENGEMVAMMSRGNVLIMRIDEYRDMLAKKNIEKHLLSAEEDIRSERVVDSEEVFAEWEEKYGI